MKKFASIVVKNEFLKQFMLQSIVLQLNLTANETKTTIIIKVPSNANIMIYLFLCN